MADRNTPQKLVWQARIVLMWAEDAGVAAIVRATGKTKRTAYRWRDRYVAQGIEGLKRDASRPGRKKPLSAAMIERVVQMTLTEKPQAGTHWSVRKLAKAVGLSHSSVQRIWAAHGLKPHLTKPARRARPPKKGGCSRLGRAAAVPPWEIGARTGNNRGGSLGIACQMRCDQAFLTIEVTSGPFIRTLRAPPDFPFFAPNPPIKHAKTRARVRFVDPRVARMNRRREDALPGDRHHGRRGLGGGAALADPAAGDRARAFRHCREPAGRPRRARRLRGPAVQRAVPPRR